MSDQEENEYINSHENDGNPRYARLKKFVRTQLAKRAPIKAAYAVISPHGEWF